MAQSQTSKWQVLQRRGAVFGALAICPLALCLSACHGDREEKPPHEFLPDMDDSPKWKPQSQSEFFADSRTMRQPVEGTVAYARWSVNFEKYGGEDWAAPFVVERTDLLKEDTAFYRGVDASGRYLTKVPIPVNAALLARGQERFGIYCSVCHGLAGDGQGMVAQRWSVAVPSFHDPKYSNPAEPDQKGNDGFLWFTALNGVPGAEGNVLPTDDDATITRKLAARKMPGYAHALSERDAWAIVAYIRVLQESQKGSLADVPADIRAKLEDYKAKLPPPPAPTGPTGTTGATGSTGAPAATGAAPKGQP